MKAIGATIGLLLMSVMAVPVLFAGAGSSGAAASAPASGSTSGPVAITGLAPLFDDVPPGGWPDNFPGGQCTWWAAFNRHVTWNGDGGDWLLNAAAQGYATSAIPQVHSIVVYPPGDAYGQYGHVGLVIGVSQNSYTVSEMNYRGLGVVDTRTIPRPDPQVEGFIL
ncbi:MAG: CHAP domain-containing protein [Candidatus Dormibacteria bacterium]